MRTLSELIVDLRIDLKDATTLWSTAELTRCIERAVSDLSRFLPREAVYEVTVDSEVEDESFTTPTVADPDYIVDNANIANESDGHHCVLTNRTLDVPRPVVMALSGANIAITSFTIIVKGTNANGDYIEESFYFSSGYSQTGKKYFNTIIGVELDHIVGNGSGDRLNVGTSNAYDVYVQLANKPIKRGSDSITDESRDTDYIMDYTNGGIKFTDAGDMVANTAYTIDYTKSQVHVDLASISQELIKVDRVEYPVGNVPQTHTSTEVWGNVLTVTGDVEGQASFSDNEHIAIYYLAMHRAPTNDAPGSYPAVLEDTVVLAASAYALFIKALQYEHQAVTDIGKVTTYLEDNSDEDANYWLTKITTDIANLRTALNSSIAAATIYIAEVDTTDLAGTPGSESNLAAGDDYIPTVNVGARVAENYADYARAWQANAAVRANAALAYVQVAATVLSNLRSYIEQAGAWSRVAEDFLNTAVQDTALAERFRAEAIERRNEAWSIWRDPKQYIGDYSISPTYQTGI